MGPAGPHVTQGFSAFPVPVPVPGAGPMGFSRLPEASAGAETTSMPAGRTRLVPTRGTPLALTLATTRA
jgi:hypothetical protein